MEASRWMVEMAQNTIGDLPKKPTIYAMYGGTGHHRYVAYVGKADNLRRRIEQHLVRRNSSVTTGIAAAALNPDMVTEVEWWEHEDFGRDEVLSAAELIAFAVLNPALCSRGVVHKTAAQLLQDDPTFEHAMRALFAGPPTGWLVRPTIQLAFDRIADLERRVAMLEDRLSALTDANAAPSNGYGTSQER